MFSEALARAYKLHVCHSSVASFLVLGGGGGARPPNVPTEKKMYMWLKCASERLRNIYIIMCQNTCYIYIHILLMQFPYIINGMALTLRNLCICERAWKIFAFLHSKTGISFNILLVLLILCRSNDMFCRLTCTDKLPNVPTKLWKSIIGGGGQLPPPPPAPG